MNKITLMGRIATDIKPEKTPQGTPVCSFRIACERNFQKKGEDRVAFFFNVVAWRATGEFISRFFKKGKMILLTGELTTRDYTDKNGNPNTWYEIVVEEAFFTGEKAEENSGGQTAPPPSAAQSKPEASQGASEPPPPSDDDYPF